MNNKVWGTQWEKEFCNLLAGQGFWVHFISPDRRGAQPFDVIAVKNGEAFVYDCKTCAKDVFSIDRLEDNQITAFDKWQMCGNNEPHIAVLHDDKVYIVSYSQLSKYSRVKLNEDGSMTWKTQKSK